MKRGGGYGEQERQIGTAIDPETDSEVLIGIGGRDYGE